VPPMQFMAKLSSRTFDKAVDNVPYYRHIPDSKFVDPTKITVTNRNASYQYPRRGASRTINSNRTAHEQPDKFSMPPPVAGGNLSVAENIMKSRPISWAMNKMGISDAGQATNDMMAGNALQQLGGVGQMMWAGSNMDRVRKIGAAAGIYGAANLAGRVVTGGGPFQNSSGDRDIMGIPFI
jgi:hypothetical protein